VIFYQKSNWIYMPRAEGVAAAVRFGSALAIADRGPPPDASQKKL
jgi:hypothetical protein